MSILGPVSFTVSVDTAGNVAVTLGSDSVNGTIPNGEWSSTSQDGWDFVLAGRTGGNGGEASIDDLALSANIVCFADGTLIETSNGPVAVEELTPGDMVLTYDNGLQPVRWLCTRKIRQAELNANPKLRPIIIQANALGKGFPKTDLRVSRQHRVLIKSRIAERMFGTGEVLVPAVKLSEIPGVHSDINATSVTYVHFLCDWHEIVLANGQPSETLFLGEMACKTLERCARSEIKAIFPDFEEEKTNAKTARIVPTLSRQNRLIKRHRKNSLALWT